MNNIRGLHLAREGELINLIIHDRGEDGSLAVESLYSPTTEEIVKVLLQYNLPVDYCMELIQNRDPLAHTMLIDLEQFEEHLKENGYRL